MASSSAAPGGNHGDGDENASSSAAAETTLAAPLLLYEDDSFLEQQQHDIGPPPFSRNLEWLEQATSELLDTKTFPLGTLTTDDVESIAGLMAAWVRRRSVDAALMVEELLKRVVDDLRAGNDAIKVTTRLYTIAMDAWAKSGASTGAAQRAQHIHDAMVAMYAETNDPDIAPTRISYNTLLNAWGKSNGTQMAERVLEEMIDSWKAGNDDLKPDSITFSTLMDAYARSNDPAAVQRGQELFDMMDEFGIKKNLYTFSALQNLYARSKKENAPDLTEALLNEMIECYHKGDVFAKPNVVNFNAIFTALSRTPSRENAERAIELLRLMETPVEDGGYNVAPDRLSFALTILSCARCPDTTFGAQAAEANLLKMEARAKREEQRRLEVSSAAPPPVSLDVECFNVVLQALARSYQRDAVERSLAIIERMEEYADKGNENVRPNIRSWNAVLNAYSKSNKDDAAEKAQAVLSSLYEKYEAGDASVQPDTFSWSAVLSAYYKSRDPHAAEHVDEIVRKMEELYEQGSIDTPPDVYHYTILCGAWAKCSGQKGAQARCLQILAHMMERHKAGRPGIKPNTRTYNAVLDCISRGRDEERAEQLLHHMLRLYREGDTNAGPDTFSFNSVIIAYTKSRRKGSGRRAEAILDLLLDYNNDENPRVQPDTRSFTHIISYYARQKEPDSAYRAEYILNRMLALYEGGMNGPAPTTFAFTRVMDAYASVKHPDAGMTSERLLKQMRDLKAKNDLPNLVIDRTVMNNVMYAWSASGDEDAGLRAEVLLANMERGYASGNLAMKPDSRSYGLALNCWSKSSTYGKAERALAILRRMQQQLREGNDDVEPNEHAYSLVINSCAFSNGSADEQVEAFEIATKLFDEMIESDETKPSSLTYGWYIQACGRLQKVDAALRSERLLETFRLCCENGLVNDFVLVRFRTAASDEMFRNALRPAVPDLKKDTQLPPLTVSHLPKKWTRNGYSKYAYNNAQSSR